MRFNDDGDGAGHGRPHGGMAQPMPLPMPRTAAAPAQSYPQQPASVSSYFDDPLMQGYVDMSRNAMGRLMQPTTAGSQMHPALQSAIGALQGLLNAPDSGFEYFRPIADRRMKELDQPGYTHSQLDQIRTQYNDPMTAQRDAARQNTIQRFAAKGIPPESGIVQQALLDLDRTYAQESSKGDSQLALHAADQDEARRQERVQVGAEAAGLAGRNQGTKISAAGQLANIGEGQQSLDMQRQQIDTGKLMQAVGLSQNLAQLPVQLQAQALASLNAMQGPTPQLNDPSIGALMQLMGMGENASAQHGAQTSQMWSSILGMVPSLLGAFGIGGKKDQG